MEEMYESLSALFLVSRPILLCTDFMAVRSSRAKNIIQFTDLFLV